MAEPVQSLVDTIQSEGGFDLSDADVLRVLDRRHKAMCARARVFRKTVEAGPTVAGQVAYAEPADLVELLELRVNGLVYTPSRHQDLAAAAQSTLAYEGDGMYVLEVSSAGVRQIGLIPAPGDSGNSISVYGVFRALTLVLSAPSAGQTANVQVDDEALEGLMAGVFSSLLSRPGEARIDLAGTYEEMFTAACTELRERITGRLRGWGPAQIRVMGVNA